MPTHRHKFDIPIDQTGVANATLNLPVAESTVINTISAGNGIIEGALENGAIRLATSTVSGTVTLADHARITAFGSTGFLNGTIGESIPGRVLELGNFSTTADSTITVSGANTYTGGTFITGATVIATHNSALGNGDIDVFSNGTVARLSRLQLGTNVTLTNDPILI